MEIEDANNAFDSLLAAAESLNTTNHASNSIVTPEPAPVDINSGTKSPAAPLPLKINFNEIHKQLAVLQKQEYIGGTPISSGTFSSEYDHCVIIDKHLSTVPIDAFPVVVPCKSYSFENWPTHFVQFNPTESVGVGYSPRVAGSSAKVYDQRKSSIAKKLATARREREGGKFKKLKTKWVSATEFFKNNHISGSEIANTAARH